MKKRNFVIALFAAIFLLPAAAFAQQVSVLIVDMDRVVSESAAYAAARPQLEARGQAIQTQRNTYQTQFQTEGQALQQQAQSGVATPDALQAKQVELQKKIQDAERDIRNRAQLLQRTEQWVFKQIVDAATPVVQELMRAKGAQVVLNEGATFSYTQSLDITNEVLAQVNARFPTASLTPPAN